MTELPQTGMEMDGYRFRGGDPSSPDSWEPIAPAAPKVGAIMDNYRFVGGDPSAPESWEAVRERTWGEAIKDTGAQLGEGVNSILGAVPDLIAPDSSVSQFFRGNADYWRGQQSDPLKQRIQSADIAIKGADEDGVLAQVAEAASQYWDDPALAARFVVTNLPSMIPGIGAAKVAQAAALAKGLTAAKAAGVATTAAGATNAVMNAGGARGEAFEDIKRTLTEQGVSEEIATELALQRSLAPAAVGAAAGFISGKTGLEGAIVGKGGAGGLLRSAFGGFGKEMAGEQLEEVAPKLTTNYMASEFDNRSRGQDVGRTMVETAIGAGPGAIVTGGMDALRAPALMPDMAAQRQAAAQAALDQATNAGEAAAAASELAGSVDEMTADVDVELQRRAAAAPAMPTGTADIDVDQDALLREVEARFAGPPAEQVPPEAPAMSVPDALRWQMAATAQPVSDRFAGPSMAVPPAVQIAFGNRVEPAAQETAADVPQPQQVAEEATAPREPQGAPAGQVEALNPPQAQAPQAIEPDIPADTPPPTAPITTPTQTPAPAGVSVSGGAKEPVALRVAEWRQREEVPVGTWVKADFKLADSQPVYQVRDLQIDDLYLPELDEQGRLQPEKRKYLEPYAERFKAGEVAPSIHVIEMEDGRLRVVDGHRRALAAKAAGKPTIRALVSPLIETERGKQEATLQNIPSTQGVPDARLESAGTGAAASRDAAGGQRDPGVSELGRGGRAGAPGSGVRPDLPAGRDAGQPAAGVTPSYAQRLAPVADELRAMAQDAGWAEQGGRLIRLPDGTVSRTKWVPNAEWFVAGMEARPDVLAQHIEDALAGRPVPAKSRRTIDGMIEWLAYQRRNEPAPLADEDKSAYELEQASEPAPAAVPAMDDVYDPFSADPVLASYTRDELADEEIPFSRKKNNDAEYLAAVERGDMEAAQRLVNQAALDAGYISDTEYRMQHRAPNRESDISLVDLRDTDLVPDDYWTRPEWYQGTPEEMESWRAVTAAMRRMDARKASGGDPGLVAITVYRAVPKDVKDGSVRNGDWVTPSRAYAINEGEMIPGGYRIITQQALVRNLFWDGNSIAELGYDDGQPYGYRNTKNNRKLLEAVTYDDDGNVIPLSKRFNTRSDDTRFSRENASKPAPTLTRATLRDAVAQAFPSLTRAFDRMLARGDEGKAGGAVVVEDGKRLADVFAQKTGRSLDDAVQILGTNERGEPQGFFDPQSGLTFLVAPNLTAESAPAVLLHEATHGQQRADLDQRAQSMLETRERAMKPVRDLLDRVADRMEQAGETGNASEATAYIVEEAVLAGRQAGFSAVDGKLLNWIDKRFGQRVGNLIRDFVSMVRAWAMRAGAPITPSIDDLVAVAKLNVRGMARGGVGGVAGRSQSARQELPDTIEVDGKQRPTRNINDYQKRAYQLERAFKAMGLEVRVSGSRISRSMYVEVESPEYTASDGKDGETLKFRVSDHELPHAYAQPDFEVIADGKEHAGTAWNKAGTWIEAVEWLGNRWGIEPKGNAKTLIAKAAKEKAELAARIAAQERELEEKRALFERKQLEETRAWIDTLPAGSMIRSSKRLKLVAEIDGNIVSVGPDAHGWMGNSNTALASGRVPAVSLDEAKAYLEGAPSPSVEPDSADFRLGASRNEMQERPPVPRDDYVGRVVSAGLPDTIEVDGVQRPTRNSAGQLIHPTEEGIRNFWRWFGSSRVVDEQGRPLVVYHGTNADFNEFDPEAQGSSGQGSGEPGFFFEASPDNAARYTRQGDGANVMPVYLALKNPLIVERTNTKYDYDGSYSRVAFANFIDDALELGHDGVIFRDVLDRGKRSTQYVAFQSEQIKSATGNNGNFDPNDRRINFSRSRATPPAQPDHVAAAKQILDVIENDDDIFADYGLRVIPGEFDGDIAVGDTLPESKIWEDGNETEDYLDGTSAAGIEDVSIKGVIAAIKNLGAHGKKGPNGYYFGDRVVLIKGEKVEDGEDVGEVLIKDAKVVGLWRKPTKGNSELIPNRADDAPRFSRARSTPTAQSGTQNAAQPARPRFNLPEWKRADAVQEKVQDRYNRMRDVLQAVREQGGTITDTNNFDLGEDRFHGVAAARIDSVAEKLKGLLEGARDSKVSLDEVALYAYAEHAPERNAAMQAINPNVQTGSGMSDAEAKAILKRAQADGTAPALAALAAQMRQIARDTLRFQLDSGLITQDEYNAYTAKYKKWVPLRGFETLDENGRTFRGTGKGFNIRGQENLRALGRDSKAGQILENIILDAERAAIRGTKNTEVNHRFLQFVMDNPDSALWEIDATKTQQVMKSGLVERVSMIDKGDSTIGVKVKGHVVYVKIHDQKLFEQMANHWEDVEFGAIPFLGSLNRYLSKSYTAWSPEFALLTNPLRDFQAAIFSITGREGLGMTGKFLKNYGRALVSAYKAEALGQKDPLYEEYRLMGGKTGFWNLNTLESKVKEINGLIKDMERTNAQNAWRMPIKAAKALESLISNHAGALENATRLASYMAMRDAGRSKVEASAFAKNLNVNFNRRGTWTAGLGSIFLFFNPAAQGIHNMYETLVHGKHKKQAWALMAGAATGWVALTVMNAMAGSDDDEIPWWDKIPQHEKERNLILVLPPFMKDLGIGEPIKDSTGRYLKFPLPYQWNVPLYASQLAVDVYRNQLNPAHGVKSADAAMRLGVSMATSFMPVTGWPPTFAPFIHHYSNKQPFGEGQLYPETPFNAHKPDSEKYSGSMHGTAWQKWASFVNEATGGSQYKEGLLSLPPAVWRNYVRSYLGGPMSFMGGTYDAVAEDDITRAPFVRKLYGEIGLRADQNKFYEVSKEAEQAYKMYQDARKARDKNLQSIYTENAPMIRLGKAAEHYQERLGKLYKRERRIKDDATLTDDQKRQQLRASEKLRSDVQEQYLRRWREVMSEVKD